MNFYLENVEKNPTKAGHYFPTNRQSITFLNKSYRFEL